MIFQKFIKLEYIKPLIDKGIFILGALSVILLCAGLGLALFITPPDYQQGEFVRIMYIHVPSAWASLSIYAFVAGSAISFLVWRNPLSAMLMRSTIPVGVAFSLICLLTGAIWGKPIWGTYWVWDARLTSMLILFFLFVGLQLLINSFENDERAYKATSLLAIIGLINLPIIRFSVKWWNTLHQPASVMKLDAPSMPAIMVATLLVMFAFCLSVFAFLVSLNVKKLILEKKTRRERLVLKGSIYS
jgi:heme exporter protein C